ncbi:MAG: DUF885 domain-containing protein [Planctomycetota bacterium]|nr:DUF885 domain-containing protein [Planctomycetota bacterium]
MLRNYLLLALLGLTACGSLLRPEGARKELSPDEPTRLHNFLDEVYATATDRARVEAALEGNPITVAIWDSLDPAQIDRVLGWLLDCKKRLDDDFQSRGTSEEFRQEKAAASQWIRWELAEQEWYAHRNLLSSAGGMHRLPARYLWQTMEPENLEDWRLYVSLLEQIPAYLGQLEATLQYSADRQTLPPKQVLRRARTACLNWLAGRPFAALSSSDSPWLSQAYDALEQSKTLTPSDREDLRAAIDRALTQKVGPAYQQLATTLDELRGKAPAEPGTWARKDGAAWYGYRLGRIAGERTVPDELHALGLSEVDRLHKRLSAALQRMGTPTQTDFFLKQLREGVGAAEGTEARWPMDVRSNLEVAQQRCKPLFPNTDLPGLEVTTAVNLATAQLLPVQYMPGRNPRIELFPGTWKDTPRAMIPAWTFAQGIPGDHLRTQITRQQTTVPILLRTMELPSIEAGWRLYATRLAFEFQMYSGPQDELGQILLELWHAACLVTDTGLHSQEWSPEQAETYLLDNSAFRRAICVQSVRDSIERPGRQCASTIGLLQIAGLRDETQARLGPAFNPNAFHRALLAKSVFPIKQIREAMSLWSLEQL